MSYSKIPNYETLSEGYLKGLTREEMLFKYGINGSMSSKKYSRKNTIKLKILKFYFIAETVNNYYKDNPNTKLDEKFIKRIVVKKTGYSEHSCAVSVASLFNLGYKPIYHLEQETSIVLDT
jgi:hypothetical protein